MSIIVNHNPALFKPGDLITVSQKYPIGHYRVPFYIRGKNGIISKNLGLYINPEVEAFGKNAGNKLWYYAVRFMQKDVWPEYEEAAEDVLEIEIFENWLIKKN